LSQYARVLLRVGQIHPDIARTRLLMQQFQQMLREPGGNIQHLLGNIGRQDASLWSHLLCCLPTLVSSSGGDIQDLIFRLKFRGFEHLLSRGTIQMLP
jgi:hypothetical protein